MCLVLTFFNCSFKKQKKLKNWTKLLVYYSYFCTKLLKSKFQNLSLWKLQLNSTATIIEH
jgi:hypothetical protein